jgi:hypothetical protein
MGARKKKEEDPAAFERAVDAIRVLVLRDGSIARSRLARLGIKKARHAEAIERLEAYGIEATKKVLRVPLEKQFVERLRDGNALAMRTIGGAVSGGTKREIVVAIGELVEARRAILVVRGKELVVTAPRSDVLGDHEIAALERAVERLGKSLKLARKQKATLLQPDVRELLAGFAAGLPSSRIGVADVLEQASRHKLASGLVFVPAIVRAFGGQAARDAVHEALRAAARKGLLELRPESGLGRLSEDDVALCLPGPQGSHLSWARPLP